MPTPGQSPANIIELVLGVRNHLASVLYVCRDRACVLNLRDLDNRIDLQPPAWPIRDIFCKPARGSIVDEIPLVN